MTQEEKELLLKDLCSRLPYNNCRVFYEYIDDLDKKTYGYSLTLNTWCISELRANKAIIKPYLRPMSSMTEKEAKELLFVRLASKYGESCAYIKNFIKLIEVSFQKKPPYMGSISVWFSFEDASQMKEYGQIEYLGQINDITLAEIDWLNSHYFDYRGLIEKGLAIEVTKENNPYED